jgi:sugar phosphate isomerase/epimerase
MRRAPSTSRRATTPEIRGKFEYCKRAGIGVIVAGDPTPEDLPRIERFVKEYDIRIAIHNHGPEDKLFPSPLDVLNAVKNLDPRIGCCIDLGHCARAGTDVVHAIHETESGSSICTSKI